MEGDRAAQPPKTMDYDLSGPAQVKLPMRNTKFGTVHYDWHWFWDYSNGDLGNKESINGQGPVLAGRVAQRRSARRRFG